VWEAESLCLDCHKFSWRGYRDRDFKKPEQYEKERWGALVAGLQGEHWLMGRCCSEAAPLAKHSCHRVAKRLRHCRHV
jgi:hypothetical protein